MIPRAVVAASARRCRRPPVRGLRCRRHLAAAISASSSASTSSGNDDSNGRGGGGAAPPGIELAAASAAAAPSTPASNGDGGGVGGGGWAAPGRWTYGSRRWRRFRSRPPLASSSATSSAMTATRTPTSRRPLSSSAAPIPSALMGTDDGGGAEGSANDEDDEGRLVSLYRSLAADGDVSVDPHQLAALRELDRLRDELLARSPPSGDGGSAVGAAAAGAGAGSIGDEEERESSTPWPSRTDTSAPSAGGLGSFFARVFGSSPAETVKSALGPPPPRGVYLHGGVGCGKTFCMDLFYDAVPADVISKQKVHFHKFMLGVHRQMHEAKMVEGVEGDVLPRVVERTVRDGKLICFDEFQVTDVADALILRRLFTGLMDEGAVAVMTSNRPPRDLYLNGLQRDRFLPFVGLLEERTEVVSMWESETDYRLVHGRNRARGVYFVGDGREAKEDFDAVFGELVEGDDNVGPTSLSTQGRRVKVPLASVGRGVARFSFDDLCRRALGAADYLAIAETFHTVFVEDVPAMTMDEINSVRRFITFVDVMYECRVKLVLRAETLPKGLFRVDLDNQYQDEAFAFDRTRSRLDEMGGEAYLRRRWVGQKRKEEGGGDEVCVGPEPGLQY